MNRCKTSYNKDKFFQFFTQTDKSVDKTLQKFESNKMSINSVASAKKL